MKNIFFCVCAVLFSAASFAQSIQDVVFLNSPISMGTPRFVATAGSFTALGNDFSGVHLNPAGLAVFRHDEFGITIGFDNASVESTYYNKTTTEQNTGFVLSNLGYIKHFQTNDPDLSVNFGITFNRNVSQNYRTIVSGTNPSSSLTEDIMFNANGTAPEDLLNAGLLYEFLAYQAYLIDPGPNNIYTTQASFDETNQYWNSHVKSHINELGITLSANKDDELYLGGSINIPFYKFSNTYYYNEGNFEGGIINGMELNDTIESTGFGVNIKLGAIYRPQRNVRMGISIFSPSIMFLHQTYSTSITTNFADSNYTAAIKPEEEFNYTIFTAPQANLGLAYVFDKTGFLSFDYTFLPSKLTRTSTTELYYLNDETKSFITLQHKISLGGELKLGNFFLRGGYSWLSDPYNLDTQDGSRNAVTLGLGYRTNQFTLDLAYAISSRHYNNYPYTPGYVEAAAQSISQKPFLISASFRL